LAGCKDNIEEFIGPFFFVNKLSNKSSVTFPFFTRQGLIMLQLQEKHPVVDLPLGPANLRDNGQLIGSIKILGKPCRPLLSL